MTNRQYLLDKVQIAKADLRKSMEQYIENVQGVSGTLSDDDIVGLITFAFERGAQSIIAEVTGDNKGIL